MASDDYGSYRASDPGAIRPEWAGEGGSGAPSDFRPIDEIRIVGPYWGGDIGPYNRSARVAIICDGVEYSQEAWATKQQNDKLDRVIALLERIADRLDNAGVKTAE